MHRAEQACTPKRPGHPTDVGCVRYPSPPPPPHPALVDFDVSRPVVIRIIPLSPITPSLYFHSIRSSSLPSTSFPVSFIRFLPYRPPSTPPSFTATSFVRSFCPVPLLFHLSLLGAFLPDVCHVYLPLQNSPDHKQRSHSMWGWGGGGGGVFVLLKKTPNLSKNF